MTFEAEGLIAREHRVGPASRNARGAARIATAGLVAAAVAHANVACFHAEAASSRNEARMYQTTAGEVMGPYVERGTQFTVELLDDVMPPPGGSPRPLRASIRDELIAADGTVIVRRGAVLHGRAVASPGGVHVDITKVQMLPGEVAISVALDESKAARSPFSSRS